MMTLSRMNVVSITRVYNADFFTGKAMIRIVDSESNQEIYIEVSMASLIEALAHFGSIQAQEPK